MAKNKLIYLTAYGGEFQSYAAKCVRTLRNPKLGNYDGMIVVFTDEPSAADLQALGKDVETRVLALPAGGDVGYWAIRARVTAGLSLVAEAFSHVCYLDCDILAQRDVSPLFSVPDKLFYHYEPWELWSTQYSHAFLTSDEIAKAELDHTPSIGAGAFVVPGGLALSLFSQWAAMLDASEKFGTSDNPTPDQSAFNALMLRGRVPARSMPREWIVPPDADIDHPDAILLHFVGERKRHPLGLVRRFERLSDVKESV